MAHDATLAPDEEVEQMAAALQALANANRLRLLRWLTVPTSAGDIPLSPQDVRPGENPDRVMTRQGVRAHLKRLAEHGLVQVRREERPTGPVDAFVIDHQAIFALLERLRRMALVTPEVDVDALTTMAAPTTDAARVVAGPRLVVLKGRLEGQRIPLTRDVLADDRGWVIGRRATCAVPLDHDPFVSAEHAEVLPEGGGAFRLLDLRTAKNGTYHNFTRLERGAEISLRHGDVIGVGASLLLFHDD